MAFFRKDSNDTVSHNNVLDENEERQNAATFQNSPLNEDVDGTYSERGFDMNMDLQYQSDPEPGCSIIRQQNQTTIGNAAGHVDSHYQPSGRRMGVFGKWGSTFWKDCQPMGQRDGSDTAKDSQSGYKEAYHSEDNLSNDRSEKIDSENDNEENKEMNKHQSGQVDVPADEMLSDEYYEQDEDNQSDHAHYRGYSNPTNSRSLPKTGSAIHSNLRASRAIHKNIHYSDSNHGHNGDDIDYEEEEDEDDPEDADFEPYDSINDGGARKKHDQAWDVSDEDLESDDDFDLSNYEDDYGTKKPRVSQQSKGFRKSSSGLERKSFHASSRQKRKSSYQEDCSEEDSDNDNDVGFRTLPRRGPTLRQNNGRSTTNNIGQSSEVRSSTRSVRKVSYVESEDSEDMDDGKNRKIQKDDIEEEDADVIEKVLWHQPKGMGDDAHTNNKSAVPVLVSQLFDTDPDWNEMEFLIKWKGQSHLHCQWKSLSDLQNLSGFKKVLNYMKKVTEEVRYRRALSREEVMFECLQDFLVFNYPYMYKEESHKMEH